MFPTKKAILNSTLAQKYGWVSSAALLAVIPFQFYCFWNLIILQPGLRLWLWEQPLPMKELRSVSERVITETVHYWRTSQPASGTGLANERAAPGNPDQ